MKSREDGKSEDGSDQEREYIMIYTPVVSCCTTLNIGLMF